MSTADSKEICDLIQQLAGRPPGEEPTWELSYAVELLTRIAGENGCSYVLEHLTQRLDENWRGVLFEDGPQLIGPFPRVCEARDQLHG
jgi:hypothetical protein